MPPSSVALRGLALALSGLCAASALAQSPGVPAPPQKPTEQSAAPPSRPAPPAGAAMATLIFGRQSAEISGEARAELQRVAANAGHTRQIELRAYAGGPDADDARKMALARALAVRSYLIDLGVKSRIEVGAFAADGIGGATDRVDVIAPGT
jgi:outer membrane protein OmpA-like peptidoglycan-associated protein